MNGSFVTAKDEPGDFGACWDTDGVDLDTLDLTLLDRHQPQRHRHPPLERRPIVITNELQYRATKAHLDRFELNMASLEELLTVLVKSRIARLCDIANALGVTGAQHAELKPSAA